MTEPVDSARHYRITRYAHSFPLSIKAVILMDIELIRNCLNKYPEIVAAYLFGSIVNGDAVANDLDILVLLLNNSDKLRIYTELSECLSNLLGIPIRKIDLLSLDLDEADPNVLSEAINNGILLKNIDADLLGDRIEMISEYLMFNEPIIRRASQLRRERLEEFCET